MEELQQTLPASTHRSAETQAAYVKHVETKKANNDTSCDMCRLVDEAPVRVKFEDEVNNEQFDSDDLKSICIIENTFPYQIYDGRQILTHHQIVPKEHCPTSTSLSADVRKEFHDTLDKLLDNGIYDGTFTRSTYSTSSSIPGHLHAHLVKLGSPITKRLFDVASGTNEVEFDAET